MIQNFLTVNLNVIEESVFPKGGCHVCRISAGWRPRRLQPQLRTELGYRLRRLFHRPQREQLQELWMESSQKQKGTDQKYIESLWVTKRGCKKMRNHFFTAPSFSWDFPYKILYSFFFFAFFSVDILFLCINFSFFPFNWSLFPPFFSFSSFCFAERYIYLSY